MRVSPVSKLTLVVPWLAVLGLAFAAGCTPTCAQTCRKVLFSCEFPEAEQVRLDECEESCLRQEALYDFEEDEAALDAARRHRQCIGSSSCDEIAAGECYDSFEDVFPFEPEA